MKRAYPLLIVLGLLAALCTAASADMLWEPYDNDYFVSLDYEYDSYLARVYEVPDGMTANLYKSPETGGVIQTLEAGARIYAGPVITLNGITWAAGYPLGSWENEGWINIDRLQRTYAHEDFAEDFGDSFVTKEDVLTANDVDGDIPTWTYPGSGSQDSTIPRDALGGSYNDGVVDFRYVYTDPDGGRWGYVGYYMGRCGWVWLDDPCAVETPLFPQTPENTVKDTSEEVPPTSRLPLALAAAVVLLVICTGVAIVVLKRKKRA